MGSIPCWVQFHAYHYTKELTEFYFIFILLHFLHLIKKLWYSETVRLQNFSFYLSRTFIYKPIFIKIYTNAIIMNNKYFIDISMTSKVIEGHQSSSNFSVNPTLPLMLPSPNCGDLSLSLDLHLVISFTLYLLLSLSLYPPLSPSFDLYKN